MVLKEGLAVAELFDAVNVKHIADVVGVEQEVSVVRSAQAMKLFLLVEVKKDHHRLRFTGQHLDIDVVVCLVRACFRAFWRFFLCASTQHVLDFGLKLMEGVVSTCTSFLFVMSGKIELCGRGE